MIAGHFGLAAGVKSRARTTPLWALMLATAWLDVVFLPLYLAGIETIENVPGTRGGYGQGIIHANSTHSLVGAAALAILFGVAAAIPWGRQVGIVLGAVVFSHWLLDLIVHRADLPILPGNAGGLPLLGFGLWRVPGVAAELEFAIVAAGAWLYWRAASEVARGRAPAGFWRQPGALAASIFVAGVVTLAVDLFVA